MRRLLLNIIALSLLLFIAVAALGVRSYWVAYSWSNSSEDWRLEEPFFTVWSEAGRVFVQHTTPIRRPQVSSDPATFSPEFKAILRQVEAQIKLQESTRPVRPEPTGLRRYIHSSPADRPSSLTDRHRQSAATDPGTIRDWHFAGFHWFISKGGSTTYYQTASRTSVRTTPPRWRAGIPLWFTAAVFSLLPLARARSVVRTRRRERRKREGRCPVCGYDMRASPERCPECGAVPVLGEGQQPVRPE